MEKGLGFLIRPFFVILSYKSLNVNSFLLKLPVQSHENKVKKRIFVDLQKEGTC